MNIQISLKFHAVCAAPSVAKLQRFGTERDNQSYLWGKIVVVVSLLLLKTKFVGKKFVVLY